METTFLLSIVTTTVEMVICLVGARQLWRMRGLSFDRSRRLLAFGCLLSGLLALWIVSLNIAIANEQITAPVLHPWIGWMYMVMNVVMTLYPISVIRPEWLTPRHFTFLFLPTLLLGIGNLYFMGRWTPLETPADIWLHATAPDVILRLITLLAMLPYCFILLLLPRNYRSSSASFWWILLYTFGLTALCVVHIVLMFTNSIWLIIAIPLMAATFFLLSTEYELEERLLPSAGEAAAEEPDTQAPPVQPEAAEPLETELWPRIVRLMDQEEVWRDPDLSLVSMARLCATNVTYLNRVIQQETGSGFKEMLNKKRVADVAAQLENNGDLDIQAAFFHAGYRSRTTAWRNFKEITGQSPAEYRENLKQS